LGNLLRRLPEGWSVTLLCPADVEGSVEGPLPPPLTGSVVRVPRATPLAGLGASPWAQLLRPEPSLIWKFRAPALAAEVRRRAPAAAGVLAVGLQMGQYLDCVPTGVPTALDNYNVESLILERLAATRSGPKRLYWRAEAAKLRRAERALLGRAARVWAISQVDRAAMAPLAGGVPLDIVPMGIDVAHFEAPAGAGGVEPTFVFVGAFDWHVNQHAATWFHAEVWPLVRAELPKAALRLVGRDPSSEVQALAADPSVTVTGTVPDVRPHVAAATAVLVPLRYGSGVRTKILEAFAAGRPVVSTRVGAEGLDVRDGEHLLLADSAADFAAACVRLAREPGLAERITGAAREFVLAQDRSATEHFRRAFAAAFGAAPTGAATG